MAAAAAQYIAASSAVKPEEGEGEKMGNLLKRFQPIKLYFSLYDNSLGCVSSMFELFCIHCPPLAEVRKLFCSGDGTAQFVGSPA